MTEIYDGTEKTEEVRRKKQWLTIWLVISALVLILNVGLFVYFCMQQYEWSGKTGLLWIQIANVAVYGCASLGFFALKYRRQKAYCKMLVHMETGLKEIYTAEFLGVAAEPEVKEGVDFTVLLLLEWNENKQNYFERKVLIDVEKPVPDWKEGEIIHFVTQANMLCSWEILPRPAGEPTLEQKKASMSAKDRELLADSVILDEEGLKELKRNRRKNKKARLEKARRIEAEAERREAPFGELEEQSNDNQQSPSDDGKE